MTGRENVYLNGSIHGLRRVAIREKLDEIVTFAGLEDFIDLPVRTYSSGSTCVGFAIAAHIEAEVLLLDEVFAVGDEAFQRKCFGKIFEFKQAGGTIVFVSHDAASVERLCDRAILLKDGVVSFDGPTHEAIVAYRTQLAGERNLEERSAGLKEWGGDVTRALSQASLLESSSSSPASRSRSRSTSLRNRRSRRPGWAGSSATTRRLSSPPAHSRP
jgi:lipopolysaccharide transport system ATP-binding protein